MSTACHDEVLVALERNEGGINMDEKENFNPDTAWLRFLEKTGILSA
jgi:hypothetical protein